MTRRCLLTIVMLLSASLLMAQERGTPDDKRWGIPEQPENCETNAVRLAHIRDMMEQHPDQGSLLILIARLGNGERRELNSRRLYNVRLKLITELAAPKERIVVAEGEPVKGFGRVEFYLVGELAGAMLVDKGKDVCVGCCDADERFYPYKKTGPRNKAISD